MQHYDLTKLEEHRKMEEMLLKYWEEHKIMYKAFEKNKGKKTLYMMDGPPYTTASAHFTASPSSCSLRGG